MTTETQQPAKRTVAVSGKWILITVLVPVIVGIAAIVLRLSQGSGIQESLEYGWGVFPPLVGMATQALFLVITVRWLMGIFGK